MNIGLVILAVYIAVLLGIALYASKKDKKNIKDFATGGGLGIFILTLTFSATYHSAYAFMGAGGFAYKNGIGWWCNGLWTVLPGVLFWVWPRHCEEFRRMRERCLVGICNGWEICKDNPKRTAE